MKLKPIILSVALLLFSSLAVFSQSMSHSSYRNDYTYTYEISYDTLKNTPSWNPEKEDAPVSLRQAIEIGRTNLKKFVPKADDKWDVLKVQLHRIGGNKHKWVYQVDFYCFLDTCGEDSDGFTIYVKLDGTIVEPEIKIADKEN